MALHISRSQTRLLGKGRRGKEKYTGSHAVIIKIVGKEFLRFFSFFFGTGGMKET